MAIKLPYKQYHKHEMGLDMITLPSHTSHAILIQAIQDNILKGERWSHV